MKFRREEMIIWEGLKGGKGKKNVITILKIKTFLKESKNKMHLLNMDLSSELKGYFLWIKSSG